MLHAFISLCSTKAYESDILSRILFNLKPSSKQNLEYEIVINLNKYNKTNMTFKAFCCALTNTTEYFDGKLGPEEEYFSVNTSFE